MTPGEAARVFLSLAKIQPAMKLAPITIANGNQRKFHMKTCGFMVPSQVHASAPIQLRYRMTGISPMMNSRNRMSRIGHRFAYGWRKYILARHPNPCGTITLSSCLGFFHAPRANPAHGVERIAALVTTGPGGSNSSLRVPGCDIAAMGHGESRLLSTGASSLRSGATPVPPGSCALPSPMIRCCSSARRSVTQVRKRWPHWPGNLR